MGKIIVRYKVKPDCVDENVRLVEQVFAELGESRPAGLRYAAFRAEDGQTFFHVASIDDNTENPLQKSVAFKAFQQDLSSRCEAMPEPTPLTEIGSFNFFDASPE